MLLDNCFPLPFIFSIINKRIKQLSYKKNNSDKEDNKLKQLDKMEFFTIPYVNSVSESFLSICGRFGFNMSHSILNMLKRYIKRGKDDLEILSHQDVVYKITCNDYDATYIGSKRQLKTRHDQNINKKSRFLSVISNHRLENNDVKIMDNEPFYSKMLMHFTVNF